MTDLRALKQLTLNRIRVMFREPEVLFWIFLFPVLLAVGIGVAFNNPASTGVVLAVEEGTSAEAYLDLLEQSPDLEVEVLDTEAIAVALRQGEVTVAATGSGRGDGVIVLQYDPTRPDGQTGRVIAEAALQRAAGATRPLQIEEATVEARGQRYIDWLIPGLIGFNLMGTGLWSVGFYTTQARENRELRRLVATPMRRSDFLVAQILARFVVLVGEIPLIVLAGWLIFGVVVEGSALALALIVIVGATCFAGLGLLAAARPRTTEGVSGIINLIMMPMLVASGVFFSGERFPDAVQPVIQALPLTALNDALRAVYNEGAPLVSTVGDLAIVLAWAGFSFLVALRWFRWQ